MPSFFFHQLQVISLTFNLRFLYELKITRFVFLKLYAEFSIFHFLSFSYFCPTKSMDSLTLKRHKSFQNQNNRKATQFCSQTSDQVATRNFKIQWCLHELELPKNWPGDEFFKLRKSKFWERHFFSIVTLNKYLTFFDLLTYLFL